MATLPLYIQKYQPGASVTMFFSAVVSKKPVSYGTFNGATSKAEQKEATGKGAGFYLTFSTKEKESITIKAGLSHTSIENARLNLKEEAGALSFDDARKQSKKYGMNI